MSSSQAIPENSMEQSFEEVKKRTKLNFKQGFEIEQLEQAEYDVLEQYQRFLRVYKVGVLIFVNIQFCVEVYRGLTEYGIVESLHGFDPNDFETILSSSLNHQLKVTIYALGLLPINILMLCGNEAVHNYFPSLLFVMLNLQLLFSQHSDFADLRDFGFQASFLFIFSHTILNLSDIDIKTQLVALLLSLINFCYVVILDYHESHQFLYLQALPSLIGLVLIQYILKHILQRIYDTVLMSSIKIMATYKQQQDISKHLNDGVILLQKDPFETTRVVSSPRKESEEDAPDPNGELDFEHTIRHFDKNKTGAIYQEQTDNKAEAD